MREYKEGNAGRDQSGPRRGSSNRGSRGPSRDGDRSGSRGGRDRFGSSGRDRSSNSGGREKLTFHTVKCDSCGVMSEVPFKPRGDKPVYCSDCFKKEGRSSNSGSSNSSYGSDNNLLKEINEKLDKIMKEMDL